MKDLSPRQFPSPLKKDFLAISFLLLLCCLAYWPLTFHILSLKNDALNYFLPVRYQVSEAIYNHQYPFWSPYFNLGYPLHGDMQSGAWNPIVQFFSLFGPYTLYKLQIETLLYIFLSGTGMYFLVQQLGVHWYAALFASAAYMLCGYNSDCCQYLNWICGAAWLPFIVLFYYRTLKTKSLPDSLAAGFFLYLLFVSAYPAHFIITAYLLLAIFIGHTFIQGRLPGSSLKKAFMTALVRQIPTLLCFLLLSLPAILSFSQYLPLTERGHGASYEEAMSNSLHPFLLLSWLTPLPNYKDLPFADTVDNLQRNSWFGLFTFAFALSSFFIKTADPRVKFSKVAVIVFCIMSLGSFGGLRPLSYYILPLMNTFRHPAGLKIFTVFFSCILAAWSFDLYSTDKEKNTIPKKTALFCGAILLILLLYSLPAIPEITKKIQSLLAASPLHDQATLPAALKKIVSDLSYTELLLAETLIQLPFIALLLFYALPKKKYQAIVLLNIFNGVIHILLFTPFTVVKKDSAAGIQQVLDSAIVKGYPLPSLNTSLKENSALDSSRFDEIGCLNMYNKKIGRNGYRISPSNLLTQNTFWFNSVARQTIMEYPLLYKPDTLVSPDDLAALPPRRPEQKIGILTSSSLRKKIGEYQPAEPNRIAVTAFTPNHFTFTSSADKRAFYILLQNYYPLWTLEIDGKEQPIILSDISFMGLEIPAGYHQIEFSYQATGIAGAWWLNIILTFILVIIFIRTYLLHRTRVRPSSIS